MAENNPKFAEWDTFSRHDCQSICAVRADSIAGMLRQLGRGAFLQLSLGEVVSLNGKSARHSYDKGRSKGAIHMVSAWASENQPVLGQVKVADKSNEITAIPKLLNLPDVQGYIVTIDAMGTQTEIAKQIIGQEADYVLSLKENQGNLYEDVEQVFDWARKRDFKAIEHEAYQTIDKDHGRLEIRRYWLLDQVEHLEYAQRWEGLKRVGMVESERRIEGQTHEHRTTLLPHEFRRQCQALCRCHSRALGH